jgi:hypothetical protein
MKDEGGRVKEKSKATRVMSMSDIVKLDNLIKSLGIRLD